MTIGRKLKDYLADSRITYDLVDHPRSEGSSHTAHAAHVPGDCLAKSVVLHRDGGYVVAVLPSTRRVDLDALGTIVGKPLFLASELEIAEIFDDCLTGAVPAAGAAYDLQTLVDESLGEKPEIWFEAGDHRTLVHVDQPAFRRLMVEAQHAQFCC